MPKIDNCLISRSEVTQLSLLPNGSVIYATRLHGIKAFTTQDCETNLNINPKNLNNKTSALAFSPDGNYIAIANKHTISLIYIPTRKIIKTIKTDEEEIKKIAFDAHTNYIITATKNGRVLQYKLKHSSLLSRIFSFTPPVYTMAFYDNLIATTGKSNEILITALNSLSKRIEIPTNGIAIGALTFLNHNTIISANIDGNVTIHNIKQPKNSLKINSSLKKIRHIVLMPDSRYIILSGMEDYLVVIDIKKAKVVHHNYINFETTVQHMILDKDEHLIVALKNRKIFKVELPSKTKLLEYVMQNRLPEAFLLVEKESMIKGSIEHQQLEKKYQDIISQAVQALTNHNKEFALQLTEPFKHLPSKAIEIAELYRAFEKFTRFQALFLEKKYALAYAMSTKYPAFQYTLQYKKMEKAWQETFADAQRQMILGQDEVAKGILNQYMTTITKRSLIKFVLNHNKEFLEFLKAIEKKEYKKVYQFTKQNKLFVQVPSFKTMEEDITQHLNLAKELIFKSELKKARKSIEHFETIPHLKEEVELLFTQCKYLQQLQIAYKENNFLECYALLDTYHELENIELSKLLEKYWTKIVSECENYALKGELKKVKSTLGNLLFIPTRRTKIGNLLRVSYHSKIKILLSNKVFKKTEAVIYAYLDIFGLDREINILKNHFEKLSGTELALEDDDTLHRDRDAWIESEFIINQNN